MGDARNFESGTANASPSEVPTGADVGSWVGTVACTFTGRGGERCPAVCPDEKTPTPCDLDAGHDGPHYYELDHDFDGDTLAIVTWPQQSTAELVAERDRLRSALGEIAAKPCIFDSWRMTATCIDTTIATPGGRLCSTCAARAALTPAPEGEEK